MNKRALVLVLVILAFSACKSRTQKNQEVIQAEITKMQAQMAELDQSHNEIQRQMQDISKELESDRTKIALSKSTLDVMGQVNAKQPHNWSDFFQNLGVLVEIALLAFLVWTINLMREQNRNQISARDLEAIIEKLVPKPEGDKEKAKP